MTQNTTQNEIKKYIDFMNNECNVMNCKSCPANEGMADNDRLRLPCGQYHCWVKLHIGKGV